jgi:hypothetical protein
VSASRGGLSAGAGRPDPYVVQAAIAACHALAPSFAATDWDAIVSWYDVLLGVHDTPVARLTGPWPPASATGRRPGWPRSTGSAASPATRCGTPPGPSCSTGSGGAGRRSPPPLGAGLGVNEAQRRYLAGRLSEAAEAEVDLEAGDRVDDP